MDTTDLYNLIDEAPPFSYYGSGWYYDLGISYISDIHLLHKCSDGKKSVEAMIREAVRSLYQNMKGPVIVFSGDVSSNPAVVISFYKLFVRYNDFLSYQSEKSQLFNAKHNFELVNLLQDKIKKLFNYTETLKKRLTHYMNFERIEKYRNRYKGFLSYVHAVDRYTLLNQYKKKKFPKECTTLLYLIASKLDLLDSFNARYHKLLMQCDILKEKYEKYGLDWNCFSISEVYKEHCLLSECKKILIVLGNHEYVSFNSIEEAIIFYKSSLEPLGLNVLQNEYCEFFHLDRKYLFYGGTGFAKYNLKYNANTLVCCNNFTRNNEIEEGNVFEMNYSEAKQLARKDNACFLCISHYPIQDCLHSIDFDTIYFYGHNHHNYFCRNEEKIIYADNQIGYQNSEIKFKSSGREFSVTCLRDESPSFLLFLSTICILRKCL